MANEVFDLEANESKEGLKVFAVPRVWLNSGNQPDWVLPVRLDTGSVSVTLDAQDASIVVPAETKLIPGGVTDQMIQLLTDIHSEVATSDISNPDTLSFGTMDAGFFGIVPASDFITGDALASEVGVTQGTSQFSNTNWLKFAFEQEIYMVPQKPIRYSVSWDHLYLQGAVYGDGLTAGDSGAEHHNLTSSSGSDLTATAQDATVTVNGLRYEVGLLKGGASDPLNSYNDSDRGSIGPANEWNALMLPIHEKSVANNWNYPEYAPTVTGWGINFSDGDLITHNKFGNGSYTWCQESSDADLSLRVFRGDYGVSNLNATDSANTNYHRGWHPRLKLARS